MHSAPCLCNKWLFSCIPYIFCKLAKRVPIFSLKYCYTVLYWWHWLNWEDLVCRSIIILFSISLSAKSTFNLKIIYPSFVTESQSIKRPNSKEFTYKREIKTLSYFVTFIVHVYLFLMTDMKSQTKWLQRLMIPKAKCLFYACLKVQIKRNLPSGAHEILVIGYSCNMLEYNTLP